MAYVPPIPGKERLKRTPSKEGLLGVKGIDNATELRALEQAGAVFEGKDAPPPVSLGLRKCDLPEWGLSGTPTAPPGGNGSSGAWGYPPTCPPIGCWRWSTSPSRRRSGRL